MPLPVWDHHPTLKEHTLLQIESSPFFEGALSRVRSQGIIQVAYKSFV